MTAARRGNTEERGGGAELKPLPTIPVYLLYGTDEYLVGSNGRRIVDGLCPPGEQQVFGVEEVNGQADTKDAVAAALRKCLIAVRTVGFFGGRKVVWFRDVSFLKTAVALNAAEVKPWMEELTALIKGGLPAGHQLVITATEVDGRTAFFKACDKAGMAVAFSLPEKNYQWAEHARGRAEEAFAKLGLRPDYEAVGLFVDRTGPDTRTIYSEADKLAVYLGDRKEVHASDVLEITSASRETAAWDLADRVGARDLPGALEVLRRLLYQKEEPIALISGIDSRIRDLSLLRDAVDRGWVRMNGRNAAWAETMEAQEGLSALGDRDPRRMHPFRTGILIEQARRFEPIELVRLGTEVTKVREQLVSGVATQELLLELLVLKITPPRPRVARPGRG